MSETTIDDLTEHELYVLLTENPDQDEFTTADLESVKGEVTPDRLEAARGQA